MLRGTLSHALILVLVGCGARSGFDQNEAPASLDLGTPVPVPAPRDAAPMPVDLPAPSPTCALVPRPGPVEIARDRSGTFQWPQGVARDGRFDLLATFAPFTDDRAPHLELHRVDGSLDERDLEGLGAPAAEVWAAGDGLDTTGLCFSRGAEVVLSTYTTDGERWSRTFEGTRCDGLAYGAGRWFMAVDSGFRMRGVVLEANGDVVTETADVGVPIDGTPSLGVTGSGDGFAFVQRPGPDGRLLVGTLSAEGDPNAFSLEGFAPAEATPVVASAGPLGGLAIAHHAPAGLRVTRVDPERGGVIARSEPLGFDMGGEMRPALVPLANGLLVASASYGDFDPTRGRIQVDVLGPELTVEDHWEVETQRIEPGLGAVGAATDGDAIVVYWAAAVGIDPGAGGDPVTMAMSFTCD
ncbi:MAG: hypothetical protein CMN30_16205 [Sandaracinus sp.]|nr:hypothetical protein [Sandaracinus sp.]